MKIIEAKDYNEMSKKAAEYISEKVRRTPSLTLGLATGGTPLGLYKELINDYQKNNTSYKEVSTFNLDEYVGLSEENINSYRFYMKNNLFRHIDIQKSNIFIPNGDAVNLEEEALEYEKKIKDRGGIDVQILGIGSNGHIGFNEPGTPFDSDTHIVELTSSTRQANARFFKSLNEVPEKALTMGIASIMRSKEILLLISGESKKEAYSNLMYGNVTEEFPASILRKHPFVTIIADKAASREYKVF